jgi:hypothetical protein
MQQQTAELQVAQSQASQEVEFRRFGEVQLARETAARREADFKLEIGLRQEIERLLTEQIGALRDEVAALRAEVVDKLGGQLRLERIETTRVIGSDLEALQHEIRRLAGHKESLAAAPTPQPFEHITAALPEIVDAEVLENEPPPARRAAEVASPPAAPVSDPEPRVAEVAPTPVEVPAPTAGPAVYQAPPPHVPPPVTHPAEPADAFASSRDPFAGLPRLSPIPDDVAELLLPPGPPRPTGPQQQNGGRRRTSQPEPEPEEPRYIGRRRAAAEQDASGEDASAARGGRRRGPADTPEDFMARLPGRG